MKRIIAIYMFAVVVCAYGYGQPNLYIGIRGGAGAVLSNEQLNSLTTSEGFKDATIHNTDWSANFKAEALVGIKHFRFGYRFMFMHQNGPSSSVTYIPVVNGQQYTVYFNSSYTNIFAHYGVLEFPFFNKKHFALTPGIAVGGYTGARIDKTTGDRVQLGNVTRYRFSVGGELNAEIKYEPVVVFFGPNYYMFNTQDKINSDWKTYTHTIGFDVGLRVDLVPRK